MNSFADSTLLPLPCGCIVDLDGTPAFTRYHLECPWCSATFLVNDVERWLKSGAAPSIAILYTDGPRPLFKWEGLIFEVVGECDECGTPFARVYGRRDAREGHLRISIEHCERLKT